MKQTLRFLVQPWTFFNQLQWSRNHWLILLSFLTLATVETQVSRHNQLYLSLATLLHAKFGVSLAVSLWLTMAAKLVVMLLGAYLMVLAIYFVGSLFGRESSQRVFFRRLAVVFTVVLTGITVQAIGATESWATIVSSALFIWGAALGFFAIREQFELNIVEAVFLSVFSFLLVGTSWQVSQKLFEAGVEAQVKSLAAKEAYGPKAPSYKKNVPF